jgi:hypothetical protein
MKTFVQMQLDPVIIKYGDHQLHALNAGQPDAITPRNYHPLKWAVLLKMFFLLGYSVTQAQNKMPDHINQVKLALFRTIDVVNPGIEVSYERRQSFRLGTEVSVASMRNLFLSGERYKGYRLSVEEKYFVGKLSSVHLYLSGQLVYNNSELKNYENTGYDTLSRAFVTENFRIVKQTAAFNVKYGYEIMAGHFVIDVSCGLGLKYRKVKHYNQKYPMVQREWDIYYSSVQEGTSWVFNMPFTIKFGYSF